MKKCILFLKKFNVFFILVSFFSFKSNGQCASSGNTNYNTGITFVSFNTINNADIPKNVGYENFTGISTNVNQGSSYNLTVRVNTDGNYTVHAFAWIDWNQDGDFSDAGETYDLGDRRNVIDGTTSLIPLSISIPLTAATGNTRMRVSAKYNSNPSSCETNFDGEVEDYSLNVIGSSSPEINITGLGNTIVSGDTTPNISDDTDFGNVSTVLSSKSNTFTIQNTDIGTLNLTGSPRVLIGGANASDFTVTSNPSATITGNSSSTFTIRFIPGAIGLRTATVSIINNDTNENPYTFTIQGYGSGLAQEINVRGLGNNILSGDTKPTTLDNTDFGSVLTTSNKTNTFVIENLGTLNNLSLTGASPYITFTGTNAGDFSVTTIPNNNISANNSTTFAITFSPTGGGIRTATLRIANNDSDENPYTFSIQGVGIVPLPEMNIQGNSINISDNDTTPSLTDFTDFGDYGVSLGSITHNFVIENTGPGTLNLTGASPYITISGAHASDFTVSTIPSNAIAPGSSTTFSISFDPTSSGLRTATISISNNDSDENPYNFNVQGTGVTAPPLYTAYYETFDISNGGWNVIRSTNDTWIWTNSYPASVTNELAEGGFWRNNSYNSYSNNSWIIVESPEYNFSGLQNLNLSLDVEYNTQNDTDGMRILYSVGSGAFTPLTGSGTNWYDDYTSVLGGDGWNDDSHPDLPAFSGPYSHFKNAKIELPDAIFSNRSNVKFRIEFRTNNNTTDVGVGFDNFKIDADPITTLANSTVAPANINGNLRLWLKANDGVSVSDGARLTNWEDQAYSTTLDKEDATAANYLAPTYRDNANRNLNYNPILDFNNSSTEYMNGKGGFFSQDYFVVVKSDDVVNTSIGSSNRQFPLGGKSDTANYHEDPTGLAFGSSTGRYVDEVIAHNLGAYVNTQNGTPGVNSYGRAYTSNTDSYNHVLIVNVKANNSRNSQEIYKNGKRIDNTTGTTGTSGNGNPLNYYEFNNLPFLIGTGRSGLNGRSSSQLNGMLGEVISYSAPNSALNKQKIQSYLGIKYGVTLQSDGSSLTNYRLNDVNYIDSQGNVIWDTNLNSGYNYDIAGIGRDNASQLNQKQSKSQNIEYDGVGLTSGFLTIGLTNTYNTNKENINNNTTNFNDRQFLVWGNNGRDINLAATTVNVDMSAGIPGLSTPVSFVAMQRIWKVVETGGDIPSCKVKIPQNAIRNISPPGNYYMFISSTGIFDPTADYRVMKPDGNGNLLADYDFDGTKYITFGYAPQIIVERSVKFDGVQDYIDVEDHLDLNPTQFTMSAWVKRDTGTVNASIISKRNASNTEGYDFKINGLGRFEFSVNGGASTLASSVVIPENEWHQLAVIYNNGTAKLYIDGVEDTSKNMPAPIATTQSFYIAAAGKNTPTAYFAGNIDEVRVWKKALTEDQLHYIMNQEIIDNTTLALKKGDVIPTTISKNELNPLPWSELDGYYPMSVYTYTNTDDMSGNGNQGALRNLDTVDFQTAPLPYQSQADGSWDADATWLNNAVQTLPNALSIIDGVTPINWNIVETNHNIYLGATSTSARNRDCQLEALIINGGDLQVNGDTASNSGIGLTVTHYLKINGTMDLEGESQLIQTENSDLDNTSTGSVERDQQGNSNTYVYNYWSSPVAPNFNSSYKLPDVLTNVGFLTSGYNGSASPVRNADYWIWKYSNKIGNTYSQWQHVRSTGSLLAGEGFTMKGPGTATPDQNYILKGKPNNGNISLTINANNEYLVGNPYASSLDANEFILDNIHTADGGRNSQNVINGSLYFWDHFAVNSHILREYEGGYAVYNLTGGTPAISTDTRINATGAVGTKIPERYIPVAQGFFVSAISDASLAGLSQPITGGTIRFKNSQRVFKKEGATITNTGSEFFKTVKNKKSDIDNRPKIRLMFDSPKGYHRQLLVGADTKASNDFDLGYDAILAETNSEDMYWKINNSKFIIQAVNNFKDDQTLPLGLKIAKGGLAKIRLEDTNNLEKNKAIYLYDNTLGIYHNLTNGPYEIYLTPGVYSNRFEIKFTALDKSLSSVDFETSELDVYYANDKNSLILHNKTLKEIKNIALFNILGQSISIFNNVESVNYQEFKTKPLSTGTYIIKVNTYDGAYSKKVLIN
ncbi:choice-of-anchor D domain-containing protein [Siansivirga zeaxanthinifaciens]|uniref:MAM protein n=1 Tax=Siansivirga zeaxanthinifaciens CC-SAMT-1 TaxID=1454006 RepID=A0A0C5WF79_9FLAO|nr:choice-of-anchor D domain-containing protein [Siansivirga zeaxanthinifaciens]AJR03869.1 MAM protein [Siansivirga zeaxanthinifaciens CC-SAMT-1]